MFRECRRPCTPSPWQYPLTIFRTRRGTGRRKESQYDGGFPFRGRLGGGGWSRSRRGQLSKQISCQSVYSGLCRQFHHFRGRGLVASKSAHVMVAATAAELPEGAIVGGRGKGKRRQRSDSGKGANRASLDGPSPVCCDGFRNLKAMTPTTGDRLAACECMKEAAGRYASLKPDKASQLPQACGVQIGVPITKDVDCST
ncbi:hypothetical protein Pint_35771 [Pistacia integerrima]|uniref:Uncharacterized protein n=1 Tax=Pistacia integerrima TaxID=434235 RepID=A0ACC0Y1B3_9ROSI|nr:hypothetical protein Pint_35771 [Pistacia integerrima]